jgi:hypothetical protein
LRDLHKFTIKDKEYDYYNICNTLLTRDLLIIAERPVHRISAIFKMRTSLTLYKSFMHVEMRERWVNRVNDIRLPLNNHRELGKDEIFSLF